MGLLHVNVGEGDVTGWLNEDGTIGGRFDQWARRRQGTEAAPAVAAGAGAGTAPTVAVAGTDEFGSVTVTAGTSPAAGTLATVTFTEKYDTAPSVVIVSPRDSATAALAPYASATTTALTIGVHTAPTASTAYAIYYQVVGGA